MLKEHACRYCERTKGFSSFSSFQILTLTDFHMGGKGDKRTIENMRNIVESRDKHARKLVGVDARVVSKIESYT